ncbi:MULTISPECIES: MbeB family mobilization protein, partial [Klebsiella]
MNSLLTLAKDLEQKSK